MNAEQIKVRKFFDKLSNRGVGKPLSWIGVGIITLIQVLLCMIPVQDIFVDIEKDNGVLIPMFIGVLGTLAGYLRIDSYETYKGNQNNMIIIAEMLQYHPIDMKEVKKMKTFYILRFITKVGAACLFVQLGAAYIQYGTVSWMNFGYIFVFAFLAPILYEVLPIQFRTRA